MAKRLTDCSKWSDPWYLELSNSHKLVWNFLCDNCDAVGVWKPAAKIMSFHLGEPIDLDLFLKVCGPERIFVMPGGNWWIIGFCDFQYTELKEDSKSPTTQAYIKLLKKHTLWIPYIKGIVDPIYRAKETDKEKETDKDKEKDKEKLNGVLEFSDEHFQNVFDEIYIDRIKTIYRLLDIREELIRFKGKVRGSPGTYHNRDADGLRLAFNTHLRTARPDRPAMEREKEKLIAERKRQFENGNT